MQELNSKLEKLKEYCRQLKPFLGSQVDNLIQGYLAEDEEGKTSIFDYVETLAGQYLGANIDESVRLVPPSKQKASGEYRIGTVLYNKPLYAFGLRENEWIQHLSIFGRTGAGKTNLGFSVLKELKQKKKPFLVFDWKRNYRDLLQLPDFKDLKIYTIGRSLLPLTFNPLIPPQGTKPKTWLKKLIEVIAHSYYLGDGVMFLLQQTLDSVYEDFGVYSGQVVKWPNLKDVLDKVKEYPAKGRESGWLSSTLRALSSLCFGDMNKVMNLGYNNQLENLLNESAILELESLTQQDKVFFIQALLLWIHHRRMLEGKRETFKHAIFIEEAHHILSGERKNFVGGQTIMDITFREIREFGESLIILDQHPSQISLPALGNTYTTICLGLKHRKDIHAVSQSLLLSEPELLTQLPVGQAIVKLQGRIPRPFLLEIPSFPMQKGIITNQTIQNQLHLPEHSLSNHETSSPTTSISSETANKPPENHSSCNQNYKTLIFKLLRDISEYPDNGIASRYKRLNISVRQGQKILKRLLSLQFISEDMHITDKGRLRIISLTEKGRQFLQTKQ